MIEFYYLATPYRAHPEGQRAAFNAAVIMTARLIDAGVEVYSPIVHSHPVARWVKSAPATSDFWLDRQIPFLAAAKGLIVAAMPGWLNSAGIRFERQIMAEQGKREWILDPNFALPPPIDIMRNLMRRD